MGSTANICFVKDKYLYTANAGDSVSVLFKGGKAIKLNKEHKVSNPIEHGRIISSGMSVRNGRVDGKLVVTRAIGDFMFKSNEQKMAHEQAVTCFPEVNKLKITSDMEFIMLASDGIWDCVDVQSLCEHVSQKLKTGTPISKILADLFDQILAKSNKCSIGTDNMSCILVKLNI